MHPHSKHPPLFFTPRSPWGGRLKNQSFRRHMRASEDEKLDPTSKNAQGLAGQMAPNQPGGSGGQPGGAGNDVWKVPHTDPQNYQVPQQAATPRPQDEARAKMWAQTLNPAQNPMPSEQIRPYENGGVTFTPKQESGPLRRLLNHVDGEIDYQGRHPGTEELPDKSGTIRISTNPKARGELPGYGPEAEEARKKKQGMNFEQADPNN